MTIGTYYNRVAPSFRNKHQVNIRQIHFITQKQLILYMAKIKCRTAYNDNV